MITKDKQKRDDLGKIFMHFLLLEVTVTHVNLNFLNIQISKLVIKLFLEINELINFSESHYF